MPGLLSRYPALLDHPTPAGSRLAGHESEGEREHGHSSPQKVLAAKKKPIASTGGLHEDYRLAAGCW